MTDFAAPRAPQVPHTWQRPTGPVDDPWAWIADRDHPDTVPLLAAENAHTEAWFAPHTALISELFEEIRNRVQEDDTSPPVRKGEWWYASSTAQGASYAVHSRGPSAERATDVVLLDENVEAAGHEYFSVGTFDLTPDQRLLAWSADVDGSEHYTLKIRDLATGADLDDVVHDTTWAGTAWSADGTVLFYVRPDEQERPYQVWRHRVGDDESADQVVWQDDDERFFVSVEQSRSGAWIIIESESKTSGEALIIPAADPSAAPIVVRAREEDVEYHIDHWGDVFVVHTNLDAEDFRVMTAPVDTPGDWREFIAHQTGCRITRVEAFRTHLVVHEWVNAQPRLRIVQRDGSARLVDLGDEPHDVDLDANPEWTTDRLRFSYESLTTPATVYDEDVSTGDRRLLKRTPTPHVDLDRYTSHREWATAPDGTLVPFDVVRRADLAADGSAPGVVYAYGSYEVSMAPWFSVARLSLLDRGWVFALAHPRGGGELGRRWYLDGKLLAKRNTFDDTNACADALVRSGWTHPARLAVRGGSAGGLLVGACLNLRPDLWSAAVAEVPFVDIVTTMSDPSLPLTVTEWEEWGDPRAEPYASYMASYSPYDNTTAREYPAMYVTAGLNDPRVSYHEPAKWVSRIRSVRTNDAPLLLRTEMGAGHAGPSGRYERWRDEARVLAFLLVALP